MRGGVLGTLQLGMFKSIADRLDVSSSSISMYLGSSQEEHPHKEKIRTFMTSVQDGNELLQRLTDTGYFDQSIDHSSI